MTSPGICVCVYIYMYKKKKFLCSDSLFSFLHAEVIFSENNMNIYANPDKNKDVQNKVLNVYCTLYSILSNKTGKCIHSSSWIWSSRCECLQ